MKSTLWVMARQFEANERQRQFSGLCHDPNKIKFVGVGAALCGQGFNEIILDDIYAEAQKRNSDTMVMIIDQWVFDLTCRLVPGGKLRKIV